MTVWFQSVTVCLMLFYNTYTHLITDNATEACNPHVRNCWKFKSRCDFLSVLQIIHITCSLNVHIFRRRIQVIVNICVYLKYLRLNVTKLVYIYVQCGCKKFKVTIEWKHFVMITLISYILISISRCPLVNFCKRTRLSKTI